MRPFTRHTGIAAPLLIDDMNTDVIIPTSRAVHVPRDRMGRYTFEELRYDAGGEEKPDFVLNRERFRGASILIGGANFGCGSSREMAVWALQGLGVRCVIAPGFGDIFRANCVKNGLLPVELPREAVDEIAASVTEGDPQVTVDLEARSIAGTAGGSWDFGLPEPQRQVLLRGLDDIAQMARHSDALDAFVRRDREARPWIHAGGGYRRN